MEDCYLENVEVILHKEDDIIHPIIISLLF
jgi:hypothetical protein